MEEIAWEEERFRVKWRARQKTRSGEETTEKEESAIRKKRRLGLRTQVRGKRAEQERNDD